MSASLTVARKDLIARLAPYVATVPTRAPAAHARCVYLSVNGSIDIFARPLDGPTIRSADDWERSGEAVALVEPKPLAAALRRIKSATIRIDVADDGTAVLSDGTATFPLATCDRPEEDPRGPDCAPNVGPLVGATSLACVDLRRALEGVVFATDPESTRYALGGVQLLRDGNRMLAVACDSRRLSVMPVPASLANVPESWEFMLPVGTVAALLAALPKYGTVGLSLFKEHVRFALDGLSIESPRLDGRFPKWQAVVPSASLSLRLTFATGPARDAWGAVAKSAPRGDDPSATLSWENGTARIVATHGASATFPANCTDPDSLRTFPVAFNPRFVAEFLAVANDPTTTLIVCDPSEDKRLGQSVAPIVRCSACRIDSGDRLYVIMPLAK